MCKADDVGLLLDVTNDFLGKIGKEQSMSILNKLKKLKTVSVQLN